MYERKQWNIEVLMPLLIEVFGVFGDAYVMLNLNYKFAEKCKI